MCDDNDILLTDPTEIANAFNSYFSQVVRTIYKGAVHNDRDFDTLQILPPILPPLSLGETRSSAVPQN